MLSKPFTKMASDIWNKAPRNTNGVERANSLAKDGDSKRKSLYCAMQSLYEKDKVFALQYIALMVALKYVSYCSEISEEQRMKAAYKRKARQVAVKDSTASLGPPDKKQHFDNSHGEVNKPKSQTKKGQSKTGNKGGQIDIDNGGRHEVEVRYHDGVLYKG